jgi:hypothetical protein
MIEQMIHEIYEKIFYEMILEDICKMICENENMYVYDYDGYYNEFMSKIDIEKLSCILDKLCLQ